jgi:wyosine [tRNA(Phe)-imidazoG37] synthetase (radical SAM superfamily)
MDVAFSGNGEPTSAAEFPEAIARVDKVLREFALSESLKIRLITNGSLLHRDTVRQGIALIGKLDGEVWFKIDRATDDGIAEVNGIRLTSERLKTALITCADLAPTWVQTCYFAINGKEASEKEQVAYLHLIESAGKKIKGVHLYGLARPSLQPDAQRLSNLPQALFQQFAERISALGIKVATSL